MTLTESIVPVNEILLVVCVFPDPIVIAVPTLIFPTVILGLPERDVLERL